MGENADKKEGQGRIVILPNGEKRIEFIRNAYFNKKGEHTDKCQTRSQIKNAINDMLKEAGREGEAIQYQIVFAATKTDVDPRIASRAAAKVRAAAKAAKEKAAKEEKEKAAAAKK